MVPGWVVNQKRANVAGRIRILENALVTVRQKEGCLAARSEDITFGWGSDPAPPNANRWLLSAAPVTLSELRMV